ncbi:MAG: NAD(P)-binding domain-containing protein [Deltaproteobacteria bacterium]|nr:NAD(P)-binding domain-containing protein [Deltaproteobacteria bacterium]
MTLLISILIPAAAVLLYLLINRRRSGRVEKKIVKAKETGSHEPFSVHPHIDPAKCIGSGACVNACPEKDILGLSGGKGRIISASQCVGHGACAAACPVGAITLVFGTETRGVDIPFLTTEFETNVKGVFIVGELGGMGLIKNAITQGVEAVGYIAERIKEGRRDGQAYDVVIAGAGPGGLGASLAALKHGLNFITIEQDDVGGAVLQYPRRKVVMTSPVDIPMYGKVKLKETSKEALLGLWMDIIRKTNLKIRTGEKLTGIREDDGALNVTTSAGQYTSRCVVLAIGRRGAPRRLGVQGEGLPKVAYRLLDPDQHSNEHILVIGGGDSAVEAALALSGNGNRVTLSYRGEALARIKPANRTRLDGAVANGSVKVIYNSNVTEILDKKVRLVAPQGAVDLDNDFVYIFAGGELPNEFLKSIGVRIERKYGKA